MVAKGPLAYEPGDVVVGHDDHQEHYECEAREHEPIHYRRRDGAADYGLDADDEQAAAIEPRYGQEVDEREVNGNKRISNIGKIAAKKQPLNPKKGIYIFY